MPIRKIIFLALALVIVATIWLIRYEQARYRFQAGVRVRITGLIDQDPQIEGDRQKLTIARVRIYTDRFPEYQYGDRIAAVGEVAEGKGGYFLREAKVEKISGVVLGGLRKGVLAVFENTLPEPHSALISGIVLGTKSSLDNSFFEALQRTGTLHVVVASGTNIALFSGALINLTAFLWGRKRSIFISFVLIWLYVALIGFQPPIVRAAIMGCIAYAAQYLGREADAWRALIIAGVGILLVWPLWFFDLGFQLSFAATATMVAFSVRINEGIGGVEGIKRLPKIFKESLATTLAAQIGVTPLIYFNFGQISLISPLVNMLVLPVVPIIMGGGFLLGVMGGLGPPSLGSFGEAGAQVLAWFIWLPLEYFVRIVSLFGRF